MFKVICIDAAERPNSSFKGIIVEGETYNVIRTWNRGRQKDGSVRDGVVLYELLEDKRFVAYAADRFIPLSDLDETVIHAQVVEDLKTIKTI